MGKKTGLFELIASNNVPIAPGGLADRAHLYAPAVEGWCSAAVCLGYLSEKNGKVFLPSGVKEVVLDERSPYYAAGQFAYSALRSLEYGSFNDLFSIGKSKPPTSLETFKAIEEATSWDHYAFLNSLRTDNKRIHRMLSKGCMVLDVGCGAGRFMQRVLSTYPKSHFVGIDPFADETSNIEKDRVEQANGNEGDRELRMKILAGSAETMNFQEEYDLLYLGESLYIMENKPKAIRNCYAALKKGGTIAILEGLLSDIEGCRICEEEKMVMAMQLDFVLQGYPFMTKRQVMALLKEAGFKNIKFSHLGVSFFLITAYKPKYRSKHTR